MPRLLQRPRGFTLVELLVAMALSVLVGMVLLHMQSTVGNQTMRNASVGVRDEQAQAVMSGIVRDLSGAGFLFGASSVSCGSILTFDANTGGGGYAMRHPVDALAAASGTAIPFLVGLTLGYPLAGSPIPSDALAINGANATLNFNGVVAQGDPSGTALPMTSGILPVLATTGIAAGDVGIIHTASSATQESLCLRVPLDAVAAGTVTSKSTPLMPLNYYTGFSTQLVNYGYTTTLGNAMLTSGWLVDLGQPAAPQQTTVVYYVDQVAGAPPMLMRAVYSLLNDTVVTAPQAVAAGVVSLQVRYGVDTTGTGALTYQTAAAVAAANNWNNVRTVTVALVTRTVSNDASSTATTVTLPAPFTSLTGLNSVNTAVKAGEDLSKRRYAVQTTEIALRNLIWPQKK